MSIKGSGRFHSERYQSGWLTHGLILKLSAFCQKKKKSITMFQKSSSARLIFSKSNIMLQKSDKIFLVLSTIIIIPLSHYEGLSIGLINCICIFNHFTNQHKKTQCLQCNFPSENIIITASFF